MVCDSHKWKRVEIRPAQQPSRTSQGTREEGPDIGLPVTYQSGQGDVPQRHQAEGAGRGQPPAAGEEVDMQTTVSKDKLGLSCAKLRLTSLLRLLL